MHFLTKNLYRFLTHTLEAQHTRCSPKYYKKFQQYFSKKTVYSLMFVSFNAKKLLKYVCWYESSYTWWQVNAAHSTNWDSTAVVTGPWFLPVNTESEPPSLSSRHGEMWKVLLMVLDHFKWVKSEFTYNRSTNSLITNN